MSHSRLSFALEALDALPDAGRIAVFAPGGEFLALYEQSGTRAKPVAVFV